MNVSSNEISSSPESKPNLSNVPCEVVEQLPRLHLEFLDGLRGLSALCVVIFHAWVTARFHGLPAPLENATLWMASGRSAVAVFIVLSGYCLMLPVVRSAEGSLRGGIAAYLKRRARRILPPYYAALGFSLLALFCMPNLSNDATMSYHSVTPVTGEVFWSHALLIHNLLPEWVGKINNAHWSVALEWQIYFLFPAILLPLWRRGGLIALLGATAFLGVMPHFVHGFGEWTAPWMLLLFAMGMSGAVIGVAPTLRHWRDSALWPRANLIAFLLYIGALLGEHRDGRDHSGIAGVWYADVLAGIMCVSTIIVCARAAASAANKAQCEPLILRFLSWPPLVQLGVFSYSLYLIHSPILALIDYYSEPLHTRPDLLLALLLAIGVPLSLLIARGFFHVFERPCLASARTSRFDPVAQTIASPAP